MATSLGEIRINVQIAGRTYPLSIDSKEEEIVRKAARSIGEGINKFAKSVAAKDNQDLIAFVALEYATLFYRTIHQSQEKKETVEAKDLLNQLSGAIADLEKSF